jgi:hypothetical protein
VALQFEFVALGMAAKVIVIVENEDAALRRRVRDLPLLAGILGRPDCI